MILFGGMNTTAHNETTWTCLLEKNPVFATTHSVVNAGVILVSVLGMACLGCDNSVPNSLREILVSSMVSNLFGVFFLVWDAITLYCSNATKSHIHLFSVSLVLSLGHLMIITLAEYENIKAPTNQKRKRHYTGLLYVLWLTSAMIGFLTNSVVSSRGMLMDVRLFVAAISSICCWVIVQKYLSMKRAHLHKNSIAKLYETNFLREDERRKRVITMKHWKLKYTAFAIFSYILSFIPWVLGELVEGLKREEIKYMDEIRLVLYSLNFYAIPSICAYLRYKTWKTKRKIREMKLKRYLVGSGRKVDL